MSHYFIPKWGNAIKCAPKTLILDNYVITRINNAGIPYLMYYGTHIQKGIKKKIPFVKLNRSPGPNMA